MTIVQKESPVLRQIAEAVPVSEIKSERIQHIISEMKEAVESQEDGVAIAAPQIGESLRIFLVSARVHTLMELKGEAKNLVCINPKIVRLSREKKDTDEGCLSVRYLYGKVKRSTKASIEAYDENGKKFKKDGHGLLAQVFQHEIDHLDGILFIDKARDVEEILPEHLSSHGFRA